MFDPESIPAPLRSANDPLAARIDDASLAVAQPSQQSFYDGWLLRYSPGKAKRARSINAIGSGILPLAEKISHCVDFYERHALPCLFRITPFSRPDDLDGALATADFGAHQDTRVMQLALSGSAITSTLQAGIRLINVEQFTSAFGTLHGLDAFKIKAEHERFARSAVPSTYVAHFDGEVPIACGSVAVEGTLAGIFGMVTAASHRGRGIASTLVAELLSRARIAGAATAYLQVEADNAPARRAYASLGFQDCYAYWYRVRAEDKDNL